MPIWIVLLSLILLGCAKTPEEKVNEAIDVAQTYLSSNECQKAIDLLEEVGRQTDDPIYLQVLASAYACRADYEEISFIVSDVTTISSSNPGFLKSLTKMTMAQETAADSDEYTDILTALNLLLDTNSSSTQPSHSARVNLFGKRKAQDMDVQILLLSIAQLGKFLHYYGNVNSSGVKGGGSAGNTCFLSYTDATAQSLVQLGTTGACTGTTNGHTDLAYGANLTKAKRRMCEALILVTNIIDILNGLDLSSNSNLSSLESVSTTINTIKTSVVTTYPSLATLLDTTSQSTCETLMSNATQFNNMEILFALIFEVGLQ
ncbi:MAG: hypothetical protein AB7I27_18195 [Bacteriovoracaceae bacterium]